MQTVRTYRKAFSLRHSSCAGLLAPYMAVLALSPQLKDGSHKIEPFVQACQALGEHAENFPVAPYILAMLKALDMEHQLQFPEEVRTVILESKLQPEDLEDVPMEMQIPVPPRGRTGPLGLPEAITSVTVGELLARWTGPSSEDLQ